MGLVSYSFTALKDTDATGANIVAAQAVAVRAEYDATYATIYSDSAGASPITQPGAVTDSNGVLVFWVLPGYYTITSGSRTETVLIDDGSRINPPSLTYAITQIKHYKIGEFIDAKGRASSGDGGGAKWEIVDATAVTENEYDIVTGNTAMSLQYVIQNDTVWCKALGATGDGVTEDHPAIQAALDLAEVDLAKIKRCGLGQGVFIIGDTLILPQRVEFFGMGTSINTALHSSRLKAKAGLEKDLLRVAANLVGPTLFAAPHIHNMDVRGDRAGTLGSGISFLNSTGTVVVPQDGVRIYDLVIEDFPEHCINLPAGSVPLHIRDVRTTDCGGYGINYVGLAITANSLHLDNPSGDNCTLGLIRLKDLDSSSNVVITNLKGEGNSATQDYTIICDNCDRTSLTINGAHNTSSTVDGSFFESPRDFIRITGIGCPSVFWNGFAPRIRTTDTNIDTSYALNDTITGRVIRSYKRHGSYNTTQVVRKSRSTTTITTGNGDTTTVALDTAEEVVLGEPVLASMVLDLAEVNQGEAYVSADATVALRLHNETGSSLVLPSPTYIKAMKVPQRFLKAQASKTYDPASIADGASDSTTVTVPCALGDFVMYSHAISQASQFVTSYVSAANTVTVHWQNETGGASNIGSATLKAYVLKESAFRLINSVVYDPASLADDAREVTVVTVPGAALGDFVLASFSLDLQGIKVSAYVQAADTVEVVFQNLTGGVLDLASGILKVGIIDTDSIA